MDELADAIIHKGWEACPHKTVQSSVDFASDKPSQDVTCCYTCGLTVEERKYDQCTNCGYK